MQKAWKTMAIGAADAQLTRLAGLNLWAFWIGWPALVGKSTDSVEITLTVAALALLVWTTGRLGNPQGPDRYDDHSSAAIAWRRPWAKGEGELGALLVAFPALLAAAVVHRPEEINQQALDGWMIVPAAMGLWGYGASVLWLGQPLFRATTGHTSPLGPHPWMASVPRWTRLKRALVVGVFSVGSLAIALVAPTLGGYEPLDTAWRDAAAEGGVLTALLAGSLASACAGIFLADALRPRRPIPRQPQWLRAAGFLALTALGLATYALL